MFIHLIRTQSYDLHLRIENSLYSVNSTIHVDVYDNSACNIYTILGIT